MVNQIKIITNTAFSNDIADEIRAFCFGVKEYKGEGEYFVFEVNLKEENDIKVTVKTDLVNNITKEFEYELEQYKSEIDKKSHLKFCVKISAYKTLSEILDKDLPYGSLTGIRPTKLYRKYDDLGLDAEKIMMEKYFVSKEKTRHIKSIVELQKPFLNRSENEVDLFVNIPFCPSRCSYCSFVSTDITKQRKYVKDYVKLLQNEIIAMKNVVLENNYKVRSMYVGGGTPSSLDVSDLEKIVKLLDYPVEFTVEVGRPDTINKDLLDMLKNNGVNRISVNPQTFNQKTLDIIGRKHSVEDIFKAYELARKYDFVINMDLIALLPNETYEDFCNSLENTISLSPDNITVHTLALKKGSRLSEENYENTTSELATKMVDRSVSRLSESGYVPYYTYRQKNMGGNLENTGYTKETKNSCVYNIDIMEENTSILATGAGAISKRIYSGDRLERFANMKNAKEYIERFDENLAKSLAFWDKNNFNNK
ncbi:MAG: coproporphyrinogen dehydrogenase HemZ [Eubacteriales bacterium]|nr:coproporphyrinogen dehydrogenase HemZ [Eubacteriales bacterium]